MKIIYFSILFLFINKLLFATNYYISNTGNDNNTGKSKSEVWSSLKKVNASMALFSAGDSILFKRGDTFRGTLEIKASGNSSKPIVFGAYGTGNKPVIKASKVLTGWTRNGNIWTADCPDCPDKITNLFIDDEFMPLGRYPNNDYLTISSAEGKTVIIDKNLNFPDGYWNNAEAVLKTNPFIMDAIPVSSQTGNRIILSKNATYGIEEGYGYFFQNHSNTLDFNGEWVFNGKQKVIQVYSSNNLANHIVEITFNDFCIDIGSYQNINIENLELTHSRIASLNEKSARYISFNNNIISYSGGNAIELLNSNNCSFDNNQIFNSNNCSFYSKLSNNLVFSNNAVKRNALIPGRGYGGNAQYVGMRIQEGKDILVEYNYIDSIGYNGIMFWYTNNTIIKNNFVNYSCLEKADGGGIYTWGDQGLGYSNRIVGNIVLNSIGNYEGTPLENDSHPDKGIYIDEGTRNVYVGDNTVAYCYYGVYLSRSNTITFNHNTTFDNWNGFMTWGEKIFGNNKISNNYFFSLGKYDQWSMFLLYVDGGIIFENNRVCDPFDTQIIRERDKSTNRFFDYTVEEWQNLGHVSDKPIPLTFAQSGLADTAGFIIFDYNPTKTIKTRELSGTYRDLDNNLVSGSIEIAPYSSIILLKEHRAVLGSETTPTGSQEFCQGTQSTTYSTIGVIEASSYDWQISPQSAGSISGTGKSITITWNPLFSGNCNISFLASGANNFKAVSPALQVNVLPRPVKPTLPKGPEKLFQNAPLTDYSTTGISDAIGYEWKLFPPEAGKIYPNETTCKIEWNEPFLGYAYLSVRAENGCGQGKYSDSLQINVQEAELAYGIINIFTPNGDGFNDYWSIPFIKDFPDAVIKIFDRNNQLLIEYKGADSSWNGTVNGELVPMGNYLYVIDLKNGKPPIKGYVTVLR